VPLDRLPSIIALRVRTLFRRADVERDLDDELRYHIDRQTEANVALGMSPAAARRAALVAFGGTEQIKEETRDRLRSPILAEVVQDARYAWRTARRTPTLSLVAIATVAVAIALATIAFTALNGVLLRALPYTAPERLTLVWSTDRGTAEPQPVSFTNAMDWRRDTRALASLATFSCTPRPILAARGEAARTTRTDVSSDFFHVLAVAPLFGRLFDSRDFSPGASPVMVVTYALWRDRFGGDTSALSARVLVDGQPVTVIGVLRPDFAPLPTMLGCHPEIYRPLDSRYDDSQRSWRFLKAIGRLAPGASLAEAQAQLDGETARLATLYPDANRGHGARIVSLREHVIQPLRAPLLLVQAGALLVLLIACANVAGLLLTRATSRQRELSIRVSLGASRSRLARQLVTENALLGTAAGALAVILTLVIVPVVTRLSGDTLPDARALSIDWRVLSFAVAASAAATIAFAAAAMAATTTNGRGLANLRDGGHTVAPAQARAHGVVLIAQLALATVVLVAAGLLARSYARLRDVNPGFDAAGVVAARVTLPDALYPRGERQVRFFRAVLDDIARRPGVLAVGGVSILPESPNFDRTNAKVVGRVYAPGEEPTPDIYRVTPGYFAAVRIPIIAGRAFTDPDDDRHPLVAVINETMARTFFPDGNVIGRRIWSGAGNAERTVIGVVGDTYQYGLDRSRTMQLYVPHADNSGGDLTLVVRSTDNVRAVADEIREAVRAVDPGVPVDDIKTMGQVLAESAGRRRWLAGVALAIAVGAMGLAAIGLYGVIAFGVSQRTPEIGLRMALGATGGAIARQLTWRVGPIVIGGLATGLLAAAGLMRMIAPLLFGVSAADPLAFVLSAIALGGVALVASALPARRATRISPTIALRAD
jgi:predicted permease